MKSTFTSLLAFVVSVAAVAPPPHLQALAARDSDDLFRCQSSAAAFLTQYPTIPGALVTYAETATKVFSGCHPTMPASLEPAYSSYASEISAWFSSHEGAYSSLVSACPSFYGTNSLTTTLTCSPTFVGAGAAAVSATATATISGGTATGTATSTAATAKSAAGNKNSGMVGMAAMMAAAGAVVVLL